jgi:hypothetical protein
MATQHDADSLRVELAVANPPTLAVPTYDTSIWIASLVGDFREEREELR